MGGLGQIEYWIYDPGDPDQPHIRSQCPPFMVGPGLTVEKKGPKPQKWTTTAPIVLPTIMGLGGMGGLGFWEVLAPDGTRMAAFRCRPHDVEPTFVVKQVARGRERLVHPGAAPYPAGTWRTRRGPLFTTRRG